MTEATKTLSERRGDAEAAAREAEAQLEELMDARAGIGLAAFEGDKQAGARVEEIEREITDAYRRKHLAQDALKELNKRQQEEQQQAEADRLEELGSRYDELARGRRKLLQAVEKALDNLDRAAGKVLEHDQQQRSVAEKLGRAYGTAPYSFVLRERILFRLQHLLINVPGTATGRREPLLENDPFLETLAESEQRKEEGRRRTEGRRREEERVHAAIERREEIMRRRDQLLAGAGYGDAHPSVRGRIEDEVEQALREEFPQEEQAREEAG